MSILAASFPTHAAEAEVGDGTYDTAEDPFTTSSAQAQRSYQQRYSTFDNHSFSLNHSSSSPAQAKCALEAHILETDRRLQETSRLGTALIQQRKDLNDRLKEVEMQYSQGEIGPELRQKIISLEKEFHEAGRGNTRASIALKPRLRNPDEPSNGSYGQGFNNPASPSKFSSQATDSPSKVSVPSRKQRNLPTSRVHDIEFVTEISTSLLAQVRQLQAEAVEREETLKAVNLEKSRLELEAEGFSQRLRSLDESEQRYKDENWSLETQTHNLIAVAKEADDRQQRLQQTVSSLSSEKSAALRELDDLKQANIKLTEDYVSFRRNHDSELGSLHKTLALGDHDRGVLQRKVEELTSQNQELAKAVVGRFRSEDDLAVRDLGSEPEDLSLDRSEPEHSPPPSPSKGAVRHTMLESETLKSSLHHAHRMIQNLKSNIHREKAEKLELKRMLQESRDELELRRSESGGANHASKRSKGKSQPELAKKVIRPNVLGTGRNSRTDVEIDEAEWEEYSGDNSPMPSASSRYLGATPSLEPSKLRRPGIAYQTANETEDAFETAHERDTATETEAFQTGAESMAEDSSDGLTETEGGITSNRATRGTMHPSLAGSKAGNRSSFISTASTSASEEEYEAKTPIQAQPQRYRLKLNRGSRRSRMGSEGPVSSNPSSKRNSPASFISSNGQKGQSLFAELGGLNGEESGEDADGTPSRTSIISQRSTPGTKQPNARQSIVHSVEMDEPPVPKVSMVDSGMMTDPVEVESPAEYKDEVRGPSTRRLDFMTDAATSQVVPITPHTTDVGLQRTPMINSPPPSLTSSTVSTPRKVWDQPFESFAGRIPTFGPILLSTPSSGISALSNNSKGDESPSAPQTNVVPESASLGSEFDSVSSRTQQKPLSQLKDEAVAALPFLSFSSIQSIETRPAEAKPNVPPRDNRRLTITEETAEIATAPYDSGSVYIQQDGTMSSLLGWTRTGRQPTPQVPEYERGHQSELRSESRKSQSLFKEASANVAQQRLDSADTGGMDQKSERIRSSDQSSQTILSADQIDKLLVEKSMKPLQIITDNTYKRPPSMMRPLADIGAFAPPIKKNQSHESLTSLTKVPGKLTEPAALREAAPLVKSVKHASSSGSIRAASGTYPPLPPDHQKTIAAAQRAPTNEASSTAMGPPALPASAYRSASNRPRTPTEPRNASTTSKTSTIPRTRYSTTRSQVSRRSSVTSFASELDERFNIRTDGMPMPQGLETGTDPRMIQAITQTMIGEYLWKYTRKPGRGEMSDKRHRRFFWVHPYTRTLYWSEQDPSTAGRAQLKAKSVAIDTIRVVTDDNPFPPGLHRKSLIIVTPGRDVKFTATTGQRHETWFNALSYLLLRTGADAPGYDPAALTAEDVAEFNPSYRGRGIGGRAAVSRQSLASYASRVSHRSGSRGPSPTRNQSSLSSRQPPESTHPPESAHPQASTTSRQSQQMSHAPRGSLSSRFSSYWRQDRRSVQGSISSRRSKSSQPSAGRSVGTGGIHDSAEDLRQVMEKQEQDADRLENVRACCDGRHDVGSLAKRWGSRASRHSSTHNYAS